MEEGFLSLEAIGTGSKGGKVKSQLIFTVDPGYKDTARMVSETALTMIFDNNKITKQGGFHTPASCGGQALIDRLVNTGSALIIN